MTAGFSKVIQFHMIIANVGVTKYKHAHQYYNRFHFFHLVSLKFSNAHTHYVGNSFGVDSFVAILY